MTITQSTPRANPAIAGDPWLSVDQLLENYPFLQSSGPDPGGEFTDSETSGISPSTTAAPGGYSSGDNQPLKPGSPTVESTAISKNEIHQSVCHWLDVSFTAQQTAGAHDDGKEP